MSLKERMVRYRRDIMDVCARLDLPLTVRSTSIQIFDKTIDRMLKDESKMRDVVYAIVVLASKCEEIHGDMNILMNRLPGSNKENIFSYESEMFEVLNYNFHFPSLYLRMYGIIAILQEKELIKVDGAIDAEDVSGEKTGKEIFVYREGECVVSCVNKLWASSVEMMDRILTLDKTGYKEVELIYASLQLPCEVFNMLTFAFDRENVMRLRNLSNSLSDLLNEIEDR